MKDLKGLAVLIVDDDAKLRRVVAEFLRSLGCFVFEANHGREALWMLECLEPGCILLDYEMPEMNGAEFLTALKRDSKDCNVLIMSGAPLLPEVLLMKSRVPKPFTPEELKHALIRVGQSREAIAG